MKATSNMVVTMHYTLSDDNGAVIDSSVSGEPMSYLHGHGNIISGLESAIEGNEAGFKSRVTVAPEEGYGDRNPEAVFEAPREQFPEDMDLTSGTQVYAEGPEGPVSFTIVGTTDSGVTLDANHPLAGRTLHFDVEITEVREATDEELAHGHVHHEGHHHD